MQDLAFELVELHEVLTGPPLEPVSVPLDGLPFLQRINCSTLLGVVGKLLRVHSVPVFMLVTKMLSSVDPRRILLVSGLHLDVELLTVTL